MRAITVRQPWAWAIVHGGKDVENRTRNIAGAYRGLVVIHAAKGWASTAIEWMGRLGVRVPACLVRGAVIGVAEIVHVHADCTEHVAGFGHTPTCSAWAMSDNWHLCLDNPRPLPRPIPWRGALGLWTVPADLEAAIREQVSA